MIKDDTIDVGKMHSGLLQALHLCALDSGQNMVSSLVVLCLPPALTLCRFKVYTWPTMSSLLFILEAKDARGHQGNSAFTL